MVAACVALGWGVTAAGKIVYQEGPVEGHVRLDNGDELFVRLHQGRSDLEPLVFLNGLTQDADHWQSMLGPLLQSGRTLIFYDNVRQGRSLIRAVEPLRRDWQNWRRPWTDVPSWSRIFAGPPKAWFPKISITTQADQLDELLTKLHITKPVHLVGLSYGGGLALEFTHRHQKRVASATLVAPFVKPVPQQDQMIQGLVQQARLLDRTVHFTDDELYDAFLLQMVITTYAQTEPTILKWDPLQPYAAFSMIQGIRKIPLMDHAQDIQNKRLHLIVAGEDPYIPQQDLLDFWAGVPKPARGSFLNITGVEHKLNESVGPLLAHIVAEIADGEAAWHNDQHYELKPETGVLRDTQADGERVLPAMQPCEVALLKPSLRLNKPNLPLDRIDRRQEAAVWRQAWLAHWHEMIRSFGKL